jgi:hypothetical protein
LNFYEKQRKLKRERKRKKERKRERRKKEKEYMLNLFEIIFLCKVTDEVVVVKCFRFDSQRLHLVKYFQSRIDFVTLLRVTKRSSERNVNDKSEEFE